jgi:hypothetical protein
VGDDAAAERGFLGNPDDGSAPDDAGARAIGLLAGAPSGVNQKKGIGGLSGSEEEGGFPDAGGEFD